MNVLIDIAPPVKKKKVRKRKAAGPRPSVSGADDGVAFLETFGNVIGCMIHSVPMLSKMKLGKKVNFGEMFYPFFNKLVINFTELAPILLRNYNI